MPLQLDHWSDFKDVTVYCHNHFYRERQRDGITTVTVMAGDYFYEEEFDLGKTDEAKAYQGIIDWCTNNAIPITGSKPKELVFA